MMMVGNTFNMKKNYVYDLSSKIGNFILEFWGENYDFREVL